MCMDNSTGMRVNGKRKFEGLKLEDTLRVDERNVYFAGKAIPKEVWREQAFRLGLPADMYLDIAALAEDKPGSHQVTHRNLKFVVDVGEVVQSTHGQHIIINSIVPY